MHKIAIPPEPFAYLTDRFALNQGYEINGVDAIP
jgi:hypothetical protein